MQENFDTFDFSNLKKQSKMKDTNNGKGTWKNKKETLDVVELYAKKSEANCMFL